MTATPELLRHVPPGGSPEDLAAERQLLGCLLSQPELLDEPELANLGRQDFYSAKHSTLFALAVQRGPHAGPASPEEVRAWLAKRNTPDPLDLALDTLERGYGDWRWAAGQVRTNAVRRHVVSEAARLQRLATDPQLADPIGTLSSAAARLAGSIDVQHRDQVQELPELGKRFLERLDRITREGSPAYSTGFPLLDELLGGGLHPGDLTVIGARPSYGKTSLARNLARNMAFGMTRSVFFSLEVRALQFYADLVTGESGIPAHLLRSGDLSPNQIGRIQDHVEWLSEHQPSRHLPVVDRVHQLGQILAIARAQARLHGTRVVFVDYLQKVRVPGAPDKRYETSETSGRLKQLALDHDLAVVALAQLSRKADDDPDREPRMSDLMESGAIEQDADQILLLHRPGLAAARGGKRRKGVVPDKSQAQLIAAKNRQGVADGRVYLRFEGRSMTFHPAESPQEAQHGH